MNAAWNRMTLGDVATIQTGRSNSQDAVMDGPFPLFDRSQEPKRSNRYLLDCEAVIVPGEGREFVPRYYCGPFDLHQRVYALTSFKEVDGRFLYYALTAHRAYFAQVATGATVKSLRKGMFERFAFDAPALATQKKIAAVLSAYDDLIENSLRRIEILEEMARDLYRQWFVEFRFPGHERTWFVDSSVGRIPEGWTVKRLGDVLELRYGKALKKADRRPGKVLVYGSSGVIGEHDEALVVGPGVIVGRKGNVGSVFWSPADFFPIDTVFFVTSTALPLRFLFFDLSMKRFLDSDAAVPGLSRKLALSIKTVVPPGDLLDQFCSLVEDFQGLVEVLRARSKALRQARDLLLPKLISGETDVSALPVLTASPAGDGAVVRDDVTRYEFFRAIAGLPFVEKVVLFGSRARDDHEERSDIDLAVFCDGASDDEWQDVLDCLREDRIDTLLKVDCVRFDRCAAVLQENVLTEGLVLYEKGDPL